MSFDELSAVSKNLISLTCMKGFDFDTPQADISSLIFPSLQEVRVVSEKDDLHFIATVLENSIPRGLGCLKILFLFHSPSDQPLDFAKMIPSLINVIEVRGSLSN
jgi:hypothetical protein